LAYDAGQHKLNQRNLRIEERKVTYEGLTWKYIITDLYQQKKRMLIPI